MHTGVLPQETIMTERFRRTYALPVSAKAHIEKIQKAAGISSETEAVVKALELGASCAERNPRRCRRRCG
jgi:hypothetical protein